MKKFLSFMLTLLTLLTFGATLNVNAAEGDTYTKVTDPTTLKVGDNIILVNEKASVAMGAANKNNRAAVKVTIKPSGIEYAAGVQDIVLEAGTKPGTFAFNVDGKYLYAADSKKNYLISKDILDDNASWKIDNVGIKAQGTNTHNDLKYNTSSKIFSCYASGQQPVQIFIKSASKKSFETTFDFNGSTQVNSVVKAFEGENVNFPTVNEWEGHKFLGWFTDPVAGTQVTKITAADKNQTLYAHWDALNPITVTLHHNDGTGTFDTLNGYDGGTFVLPTLADKPELVFDGWYDAAEGGNKIETVNSTIELYAHWRAKKMFTVSFHSEGNEVHTSKGEEHSIVNFPTDPVKAGYVFTGWYDQLYFGNKVEPSTYEYTENTTLYAHFEKENTSVTLTAAEFPTSYQNKTFDKGGISFESTQVATYDGGKTIQFKGRDGVLNNTKPLTTPISKIQIVGPKYAGLELYTSASPITDVNTLTPLTLEGNTYNIPEGHVYFQFKATSNACNLDSITFVSAEKDTFEAQQTMSSLAISYDDVALTANKISLRFGGRIENTLINTEANEYGVIILSSLDAASINSLENLNKTALEALKAKGYAKELNPVAVEGKTYSQFAAVITNITPENYNFEFTAFIYEVSKTDANAVVTLAQGKQASVNTLVDTYINNAKELNIPEAVVTVLKNLGK